MPSAGPAGSSLALARAKYALDGAGLDPNVTLTRASSVTNEVWLTPEYVIRVNRRPDRRLHREAQLGPVLPTEVQYPEIIGYGAGSGFDWLVVRRSPGKVLSRCWPAMTAPQRRSAVRDLARMLRALHRTRAPGGLDDIGAPQLLRAGNGHIAVAPLLAGLERARKLPHVNHGLVDLLVDITRSSEHMIEPFTADTLIHGDLTFENVLWDDDRVTALIDFEWARAAPPDLDLDVFLRFCAFPELHVAEDYLSDTDPRDYRDVAWWLREDYQDLFVLPHALERLRLYSIAFDVRQLLSSPPTASLHDLPPSHALQRLHRLAHRRSYLDNFASGPVQL